MKTITITILAGALLLTVACGGAGSKAPGASVTGSSAAARPLAVLEFPPFSQALETLPSSAVVAAGLEGVACYASSGELSWQFDLPEGEQLVAPPAGAANSATYLRTSTSVYCLSPDGRQVWTAKVDAGIVPAVIALPDSTAVVTSGPNVLVNFDSESGNPRWRFELPGGERITSAPRSAASNQVFVRGDRALYAIGPAGVLAWEAPFEAR